MAVKINLSLLLALNSREKPEYLDVYTGWATKKQSAFRFVRVLVIFSPALVCILRRVSEQLVNSRAVTMLMYTRCTCNIVILLAANARLMLSFSSCIVCGFDSYTVLFKCPQRKFLPPPGTEGQYQPRSCNHQNHYVTSGIPQHDQM